MRLNLFAGLLSFGLFLSPLAAMAQAHGPRVPGDTQPFVQPQPSQDAMPTPRQKNPNEVLALPDNPKYVGKEKIMPGLCGETPAVAFKFLAENRGMLAQVFGKMMTGAPIAFLVNDDNEWVFLVQTPRGVCVAGDGVGLIPAAVAEQLLQQHGAPGPQAAPGPQGQAPQGDDDDDDSSEPQAYHQPGCELRKQGCPETEEQLSNRQRDYRMQADY